jgi:hypothetical protein
MEMNEETYGLFDRYLAGNLAADEKTAFEKELAGDEMLRNELQWMSLAISGIRMNGKSILKKQLAEIGGTIPAAAFEKYSPSIKPQSFFKKWWWAIAVVAAAGIAVTWFAIRQHSKTEKENVDRSSNVDVNIRTAPATPDKNASPFGAPQSAPDSIKNLPADSARARSIRDTIDAQGFVHNLKNGEKFYGDDNCRSFAVHTQRQGFLYSDGDTARKIPTTDYAWSEAIFNVECCPQKNKPAFYTYSNHISLHANYADTSGLRFYQHGKDIMMTDNKPGYFLLTKTQAQKPLVRIQSEKEKVFRDEPKIKKLPQKSQVK